jgi:hypothetical protein
MKHSHERIGQRPFLLLLVVAIIATFLAVLAMIEVFL